MKTLWEVFAQNTNIAFSGSRSCPGAIAAVNEVFGLVGPDCQVYVGCAKGVDSAVRQAFMGARVFYAENFKVPGAPFAAALAQRSAACVRSVAPGGLVVVCPQAGRFCPAVVVPAKNWKGGGSGSWASAAYALGLGCSVLLWVSPDTTPPKWARTAQVSWWPCSAGGNWWLLEPQEEAAAAMLF